MGELWGFQVGMPRKVPNVRPAPLAFLEGRQRADATLRWAGGAENRMSELISPRGDAGRPGDRWGAALANQKQRLQTAGKLTAVFCVDLIGGWRGMFLQWKLHITIWEICQL